MINIKTSPGKELKNLYSSQNINLNYYLNTLQQEGFMAYEYNPLHNYRLTKSTEDGIEAGSIVDLDTEELQFDLEHPVEIEAQPAYDDSINLILNDGKNQPRLINSRFSQRQLGKYEIIDRIGDNDTNLYDSGNQFKQDTSLYKKIQDIPKVVFNEVIPTGNLKVGNYTLYFRYEDADGNETDFVAESGIISVFKGNDKDPLSIDGGIADMLAYKTIHVTLKNIDNAYDYVKVYIVRNSAQQDGSRYTEVYKLNKKFVVRHRQCNIIITGNEEKEDLTINDINVQYFLASSAKTQAQCQNMLFLGNLEKPSLQYQNLIDLSLQITPFYEAFDKKELIGDVDVDSYIDTTNAITNYEYYNTQNIYYHVGYWDEEIYRLGIVYIMYDGSLSPVFNILGNSTLPLKEKIKQNQLDLLLDRDAKEIDLTQHYAIDEELFTIIADKNYNNLNAKGVVRINDKESKDSVYGIGVSIRKETLQALKKVNVKGFFIVRQKRIPTILAQAFTIPIDPQSNLPVIKFDDNYFIESFLTSEKSLSHNYKDRLYQFEDKSTKSNLNNTKTFGAICPEFETNQHYFNTLFTGSEYPISISKYNGEGLHRGIYNNRFYTSNQCLHNITISLNKSKIVAITDENPLVSIDDFGFRAVAGEAETATSFRYIEQDKRGDNKAINFVRGLYSPYLGLVSNEHFDYNKYINIYIPGYSLGKINQYFKIRYEDDSPYFPISDRFDISDLDYSWNTINNELTNIFFRGDCYICNFTHRLNRNFQDPAAPTNDTIIDSNCWKDNYDADKSDKFDKINLGDVNAIQLGSWFTLKVRSSTNLSIRSLDESHINEKSITGNARGFYPLQQATVEGSYKISNSYVINDGFRNTTGAKEFYIQPDVPAIKNKFQNRIAYSEISVKDSFKNGYRVFNFTNYRDYSNEYGSIIKLLELNGNLLCVFEHGVTLIPINEKNLIQGSREVFINSNNVLPMTGQVLSNMYGSQWSESIIKTPYYIYGVDTIGKKIWRTNGQTFEIISDGKVNKYLIDNISLGERENTPIIGVRNVKTHYNANKSDVMFTFYNSTYGFEEKAWNLCWNEILQQFVTFYSWIPSYSANIDNQFYSFNRDTSKAITKLSGYDGLCFEHFNELTKVKEFTNIIPLTKDSFLSPTTNFKITIQGINNRFIPSNATITYTLVEDNSLNKLFQITGNEISLIPDDDGKNLQTLYNYFYGPYLPHKVGYLKIKANITTNSNLYNTEEYQSSYSKYAEISYGYYEFIIAITTKDIYENNKLLNKNIHSLTTDLWKHGTAGIYDIKDPIKPTFWYGEQHPFEFEFVVNGNGADSQVQKIFNNLIILSNKAEPESFHFDIVGEGYEFSKDKLNMYYRQESTKELFQNMGSDIIFNHKYKELTPIKNVKSSIFPLYYYRKDTYNEVYDSYYRQNVNEKDTKQFFNMSGSEIYWDKDLNEFRIVTHIPNNPINKVGRLRGNSHYKEDRWDIQIPSITFKQKNEQPWVDKTPPIVLKTVPQDLTTWDITDSLMPNNETTKKLDLSSWAETKETKIRDKYIRIRVRYSGKDLAIITAIHTLYTLSYA